jgi:hypothetical protein
MSTDTVPVAPSSTEGAGRASRPGRPFPSVARYGSTAVVAAIAAWASYRHMVHLAQHYGQPVDIAYLLPLSVDGMMVVASLAMVAAGRIRASAVAAFLIGIGASLWANGLAAEPNWVARVISAWPALALVLVVELLVRQPRRKPTPEQPEQLPDAPVSPAPLVPDSELDRELAELLKPRPSTPAEWVALADRVEAEHPDWTATQVAAAVGCSDRYIRNCRKKVQA